MQIIRQLWLATALLLTQAVAAHAQPAAEQQRQEVVQFLKDFNAAIVSRNLDRVMTFYAEQFAYQGRNKADQRRLISGWIDQSTRYDLELQRFESLGDNKVLIDAEGESTMGTVWKGKHLLIKEDGQWKWLGKQQ